MKFAEPFLEGTFLKRYKRFFADVRLPNGEVIVALVPNTGSMKGCNIPESPCRLTYNSDPSRKLKYTLEMIKAPSSWVGVNTAHPNKLVWEHWESGKHPGWKKFDRAQREVKIHAESRIDMVLWNSKDGFTEERIKKFDFSKTPHKFHFVEVKNVSLAEDGVALFPDSVTERGQKHLNDLMALVKKGHTAEILFTIQREDAKSFAPADLIDPEYGKLLRKAEKAGVLITPLVCQLSEHEVRIQAKPLRIRL